MNFYFKLVITVPSQCYQLCPRCKKNSTAGGYVLSV